MFPQVQGAIVDDQRIIAFFTQYDNLCVVSPAAGIQARGDRIDPAVQKHWLGSLKA
jgi:hypothetical protein